MSGMTMNHVCTNEISDPTHLEPTHASLNNFNAAHWKYDYNYELHAVHMYQL